MKLLKFDSQFIISNMDALIHLVDYVPLSFVQYDMQGERDEFLKSQDLLSTIRNMEQLIDAKCDHYENPTFARNCVVVEWLDCHPEFEGIISEESSVDYNNLKQNENFMDFIDFLHDIKLPSEKDRILIEDTSSIKYPNFEEMRRSMCKYPSTLLGDYLAYLVKY